MRVIEGGGERGALVSTTVVLVSLLILALTVAADFRVLEVAPLIALITTVAVAYRSLLRWDVLLSGLMLVILFIPIKRYALPAALPFELEPYRVVVALVAAGWLASLLIDPRIRLRRTGLELPVALFALAILASVLANTARISGSGLEEQVVKSLSFFASFFILIFLIASVLRTRERIDVVIKTLALGGAVVAGFAIFESRTGTNVFNQLTNVAPFLRYTDPAVVSDWGTDYLDRAGRLRVYASAQHPISLAAALVMLVPLAVYLAQTSAKRWWLVAVLLTLGALATVSRTGVVMLLAVGIAFLAMKPAETRRLWPAAIPALLIVYFALPNTLGSLYNAFFPAGGIVAEQQTVIPGGELTSDGRIADIAPSLEEFRAQPLFGQGFGTRIVVAEEGGPPPNARILDNQWLSILLQAGLAGALALLWIFWRFIRRCGRLARSDPSPAGWLPAAIVASVASYAVGMFTYDAFSFIQVTFLAFIMLGLGGALLANHGVTEPRRARAAAPVPSPAPGR